ncbi:DUF6376 family protein [Thermoflavimicrobium dichotomicum]|uniref:Lipoprotein n=1 Tax=Thermoflavimicrobium dichotomicum TaxID=46223 RepID=A0A1I3LNA2_9BACL|nr:DUF6376 family protein [Thermoflavimicrobium dichotomicum]SFI86244.1 hypothetical protein SAMN05421852_102263 [Thermoflavimicrobium dichotomicum]
MKKIFLVLFTAFVMLTGCSYSRPAGTVDYVKTSVRYINIVNHLANNVSDLAAKAASDVKSKAALEKELKEVKSELQKYNEIIPPDRAENIHQKMLKYNQTIEKDIDAYLNNIKNGKVDPKLFQTPALKQTIQEMTKLRDEIQRLDKY